MTICSQQARVFEALVTAEASDRERSSALAHSASCPDCAELRDLHEQLEGLEIPEPDLEELALVRGDVLGILRTEKAQEPGPRRRPWAWVESVLPAPALRPVATAATLVAVASIGFMGGRLIGPGTSIAVDDRLSIAPQVSLAAARAGEEAAGPGSPFEYSNVRLEAIGAGEVRLSFDVATHLELVRAEDDPLVSEVVIQSLLSGESVGTKLDAIETAFSLEPRVRDALISSMLGDEMLAVRLKAIARLTALATEAFDPAVESALLEVLRRDASVQMRLVAIDSLTRGAIDPEVLRSAIWDGQPEPGTAVLARAERYLRSFS